MNINLDQLNDIFWNANTKELVQGYIIKETIPEYICIRCGKKYTKGIIYQIEDKYYEAEMACIKHISKEHDPMFSYLLNLDKNITGISERQKMILLYLYQELDDRSIAQKCEIGSASTVRNHRYQLRQREKQSKIFLAIMNCLKKGKADQSDFMEIHKRASMIDSRYAVTEEEKEKYLKQYFPYGPDNELSEFPKKEKRKLVILHHIMQRFELNKKYTEKQVNEILKSVFHDYVTLRRYLIEYGFMERKPDGSSYWVKV